MTSQPEAALTEAQAAYEAALNEWQELQRWRHFIQMELKAKVVDPAVEYISLLEARIASLEAEVEAAVDKNEQLERDKERMEYRMPDAEMIVVNAHAWCDKMGAARQYGNGSKIPLWIRLLIVEVGFEQATQAEHAAAQAPADAESGVTA